MKPNSSSPPFDVNLCDGNKQSVEIDYAQGTAKIFFENGPCRPDGTGNYEMPKEVNFLEVWMVFFLCFVYFFLCTYIGVMNVELRLVCKEKESEFSWSKVSRSFSFCYMYTYINIGMIVDKYFICLKNWKKKNKKIHKRKRTFKW